MLLQLEKFLFFTLKIKLAVFTSERSCADRQFPSSFWQGMSVYHLNRWQELLRNIFLAHQCKDCSIIEY